MKTRVRDLIEQGDRLFSARMPVLNLWQTMAENFYVVRADFTRDFTDGEEFAAHLMTGRPLLAQRDLGNAISSVLRPRGQSWFHARTADENVNEDATALHWLDAKTDVLRRIMYHPGANFLRATKQGDNDFVTFGQAVIEVTPNKMLDGLLYRCWHLRDVAWCENDEGRIDTVHRNWKAEARVLNRLFKGNIASPVKEALEKEPYRKFKTRHIIIPSDEYDLAPEKKGARKLPYVSIHVDCENEHILEEVPAKRVPYVIPRWVTVSGSQYAHSPATIVALPDARLLQEMTLTLLESGQKAVDPPMKATSEAIVGGVNTYAGGITWTDYEYDEKMGKALEPIMDTRQFNLGWGQSQVEQIEYMITEAFFLNKIALPPSQIAGDMTKWEGQQRVEEYIRGALPLFEPMEVEYNGGLCELTWETAMDMGAFGPVSEVPEILKPHDIRWTFDSPLQAANERTKANAFVEASNLLTMAAQIDPSLHNDIDYGKAFREALPGVGAPSDWIRDEQEAEQAKQAEQQAMAMQQAAMAASEMTKGGAA